MKQLDFWHWLFEIFQGKNKRRQMNSQIVGLLKKFKLLSKGCLFSVFVSLLFVSNAK